MKIGPFGTAWSSLIDHCLFPSLVFTPLRGGGCRPVFFRILPFLGGGIGEIEIFFKKSAKFTFLSFCGLFKNTTFFQLKNRRFRVKNERFQRIKTSFFDKQQVFYAALSSKHHCLLQLLVVNSQRKWRCTVNSSPFSPEQQSSKEIWASPKFLFSSFLNFKRS